jgi:flagellar L-ring protein precursor FlgH
MTAAAQDQQGAPPNPSLYSPSAPNLFLFRDLRARNVNDIVNIVVVENSTASNSANTATQKKGDASITTPNYLFGIKVPANPLTLGSATDFTGTGSTTRSGQLNASISARVVEVLPNGDLVIEGRKEVTINREHQILAVRGTVRQYDISAADTVLSTSIANMEINFDGKGIVSDANKPALLSKIFKYILPF